MCFKKINKMYLILTSIINFFFLSEPIFHFFNEINYLKKNSYFLSFILVIVIFIHFEIFKSFNILYLIK